ncbi:hypothetical protein [Thalassobacterium maritimum]|uniref:hypothetical protein n=1 Tax=Thalassobacterium maritimum TaxID=3041265 RepID=UPI002810D077|nr:hypothetical protein [Coraliomargarita sp. SDUM461003]
MVIITFVKVETRSSEMTLQRLLAQNNALLGMQVALGELQVAAGPDQRITANAAILEEVHATKANYTLVWDSQLTPGQVGAPLQVLASGVDEASFESSTRTDATWPELVSARQSGAVEAVKAAPVSILSAGNHTSGEMAWWVGDEGVKAKFNLTESSHFRDALTEPEERLGVSGRYGVEALEAFAPYYAYSDTDFVSGLRKIISPSQAAILDNGLAEPLSDYLHDVSFYSRGLLTNTREGGLQKDLTYYFENPAEAPSGAISPGGGSALDRVTWEQLQSFYQLGYERSGDTITARAQEADSHGVYPLLVMLHMNFGFTVENNYAAGTPSDPAERNYQIYGHMRPWFVLANPYNTELSVSNYRIRFNQYTAARLQVSYQQSGVGVTDLIDESMDDYLKNLVFVVPEVTLQPGEALYFTLDTTDHVSYGYSFTAGSGGFYAPYEGYATNTPQQFVFTAADDAGLTSIRMQNAGTVSGDLLEDGNATNPRLRQMYMSVDNVGAYWMRTYLGASAALGDDEQILQDIGRFGVAGVAHDNQYSTYHGFWAIDALPESLFEFDGFVYVSENRDPGETMRSTSLSFNYAMHSAVNQDVDLFYSGYDGWGTDYNIRAPRMARYKEAQRHPVGYEFIERPNGSLWFDWVTVPNLGDEPRFPWAAGYSRTNFSGDDPAARVLQAVLFDVPVLDSQSLQPALSSLGQLQHFNAGGWTEDSYVDDASLDSMSYSPSYAIGNSYAAPQVPRESTQNSDAGADFTDLSYRLNEALFDRYFFSSIPQADEVTIDFDSLPNKRLVPVATNVSDSELRSSASAAAENLFIDGAFNVNSTSVAAWYSLLNSFRGFDFGAKSAGQGIFPRSLQQDEAYVEGVVDGVSQDAAAWAGWRHIEDDPDAERKLYELAEAIVAEVKARGPFVSMADFVNRRTVSSSAADARFGLSGALQSALDRTLNLEFAAAYSVDPDNMASRESWEDPGRAARLEAEGVVDQAHLGSGPIMSEEGGSTLAEASSASTMPGWVLQGDLLQSLAPGLSVRSDTFTIRAYGSVLDPVSGKLSAEAYVEAVVQRSPQYVDTKDAPDASAVLGTLSSYNQLVGRKFTVVDIRFLDESSL